jgi:hypothetical protein
LIVGGVLILAGLQNFGVFCAFHDDVTVVFSAAADGRIFSA